MVAFELIKCFAPAAAANLFFHSLFSLRMGRVIEREIAALAAPKGTVQPSINQKMIELMCCCSCGGQWEWSGRLDCLCEGLWGAARPIAPHKERQADCPRNVFSSSFLSICDWMNMNEQIEKEMERGRGQEDKQFMNEWMNWVGYGRWPSCSAPIPFH